MVQGGGGGWFQRLEAISRRIGSVSHYRGDNRQSHRADAISQLLGYEEERSLVTLKQIGKTIVLSGSDRMGREVVDQLYHDGQPLDNGMHYVVEGMSEDETDKTRSDQESVDEVNELLELGRNHDMYETLDQLLEKPGVGVVDERFQGSEMDVETMERTTPVKQARKSQKLGYVEICAKVADVGTLSVLYVFPEFFDPPLDQTFSRELCHGCVLLDLFPGSKSHRHEAMNADPTLFSPWLGR